MQDTLEILLVRAHFEAKKAWDLGANAEQMKSILNDIRHAQWRWDYCTASHGAAFHSPIEVSRIISSGINIAQNARLKLARLLAKLGFNEEVPYPDLQTKADAQQLVGLDMETLTSGKKQFLEEIVPKWIEQARERESKYPIETAN
jgi:nitrite reductase (cytochrome c-552)